MASPTRSGTHFRIGSAGDNASISAARRVRGRLESSGFGASVHVDPTATAQNALDACAQGLCDIAVVPCVGNSIADGLTTAAVLERGSIGFVWAAAEVTSLRPGLRVAVADVAVAACLQAAYPEVEAVVVPGDATRRGDTLQTGFCGAAVWDISEEGKPQTSKTLPTSVVVPPAGHGAFQLVVRTGTEAGEACSTLNHEPTARDVQFERAVADRLTDATESVVGVHAVCGAVVVAVVRHQGTLRRAACSVHPTDNPAQVADLMYRALVEPMTDNLHVLVTREAGEGEGRFEAWSAEAGWTVLHLPLVAFEPAGTEPPEVTVEEGTSRWIWLNAPQASLHGIPTGWRPPEWRFACGSPAAAKALPEGIGADWVGSGAPGQAMLDFAAFLGPLGPATVCIPHSDSSVPRWEEAFAAAPLVRAIPWLAYRATSRETATLPAHNAAVLTGPAQAKAWKARRPHPSGAQHAALVAVGASTADATRDLGLVPHAVSSSADDAAVFEALVWAMACAAAEEGR